MWATIGQDRLLRQLSDSLQAGRVAHSYLLAGPPAVGKMTLAMDLAAAVNCRYRYVDDAGPCQRCDACTRIGRGVYADLNVVAVGGDPRVPTRISIEQVRQAESFLSVTPVEGDWKVVIFDGAETLSAGQAESANALLKTLEEPPPGTLLLLLTANPDAILPTVRSRCRLLPLRPMPGAELAEYLARRRGATPERAEWLARLARGCPGWALRALDDETMLAERAEELGQIAEMAMAPLDRRFEYAGSLATQFARDRESVRQRLYLWQRWWRDVLLHQQGVAEHAHNTDRGDSLAALAETADAAAVAVFLRRIQETLAALDANANPRLALECLMLDAPAPAG